MQATATVARPSTSPSAASKLARFWHKNKYAWLFLLPWIVGLVILDLIPIFSSLYLSMTNFDLFTTGDFVGLNNYVHMFTENTRYAKALSVTFRYVLIGVPLQLLMALTLAMILNRGLPGLVFFRAAFYLPSLMGGSVAVAILWRRIFGSDGVINMLLSFVGVQMTPPISWVSHPNYNLYTLILLLVWAFGSPMIIFLAGLKQIPQELYEAAAIDGASHSHTLRHITLPLLTPIIFFNLIMQIISAFQAFTPAFIIGGGNSGGPLDSILFYTLYLYFLGFVEFRMGYAAAMAWVLLIIIAIFTLVAFMTSGKWVYYAE